MYYAEIDENGICKAVTETAGPIDLPTMIPIEGFYVTLLGQQRVGVTWQPVPVEPEPDPGPSRLDQLESVVDAILNGGAA